MSRPEDSSAEDGCAPGYSSGYALADRLERLMSAGGKRLEIGRSREGRPIQAYHWTVPAGPGSSGARVPGVLLLSLLHPMEWIGLEAHLALLEGWLTAAPPADPPPACPLPAGTAIYSLPVANPDGYARVMDSLRQDRRRWVRGNASGIDLNRNFPVSWRPRSPRLDFWPLYRPGGSPLSEPETAAIAHWAAGCGVDVALSLHSFGRWIFHPPSAGRALSPQALRHQELIRRALRAHPGAGYAGGVLGRWSVFYRANGTEIDFLAEKTGGLSYLVEISRGGLGRWGRRRLLTPFFLFNPPRPQEELARVLPLLRTLVQMGIEADSKGQRRPSAFPSG